MNLNWLKIKFKFLEYLLKVDLIAFYRNKIFHCENSISFQRLNVSDKGNISPVLYFKQKNGSHDTENHCGYGIKQCKLNLNYVILCEIQTYGPDLSP